MSSAGDTEAFGGWPAVLGTLGERRDLTAAQAGAALGRILAGEATAAQIAGFIVALRLKGESVAEVSGMVDAMLDACEPLDLGVDAIDIVGTGGSRSRRAHALNISTMAALVAAAAGATVCKHGNRKASSTSGSFDLLEALGVAIDISPAGVAECVRELGIGFAFARAFHPAMRFAGPVRAELGIPTVFNLLGPLSHPARLRRQVIGVGDPKLLDLVAGVLSDRGSIHALVVHGADGLDELTVTGITEVREVRDATSTRWQLDPSSLGLEVRSPDALRGGDPGENAAIARRVFGGEPGPARDVVLLNAAAGLYVADLVADLAEGLAAAAEAVDAGRVEDLLARLAALTSRLAEQPS